VAVSTADGRYTIQVPGSGTLVFRALGYSQPRVPVENRSVVNATLQSAVDALDAQVDVPDSSAVGPCATGDPMPIARAPETGIVLPYTRPIEPPPVPIPNACQI
jgi:hypothetical protein